MKRFFKISLFWVLPLFFSTVVIAQSEFGKVTLEELQQKTHPKDSSAKAALLLKRGTVKFNLSSDGRWTINLETQYKIKIYNKEGFEYANHETPYFVGGSAEKLFYNDAVTYNLVNGKIEKTKLKSEGVFTEEVNENWKKKKISMPAVKEGSIIEFTVSLSSPYVSNLNDFYMQSEIPIDFAEYNVSIPEYFMYRSIVTGYEELKTLKSSTQGTSFNEQKISFSKHDMPAIIEEKFVDNIENYISIVKYELVSISYPGRPIENVALEWTNVVKEVYANPRFGGELKLNSYFEDDVNQVIKDLTLPQEKLQAIYTFLQKKMNWNEKYGYTCKEGVKKAYKDNVGNVAEINLMLVAMLRYAGFEANPLLISTKNNGVAMYPTLNAFNYVVAHVNLGEKNIFLDATEKNLALGMLPYRAYNWNGRLVRKEGSSMEIPLQPEVGYRKSNNLMVEINANEISGKFRNQKFDYAAYSYRNEYGNSNQEDYISKKEKEFNIEISDLDIKNSTDLYKPISETFSFKSTNFIESIGDKLYVPTFFFLEETENPFKLNDRKYPIDFAVTLKESSNILLKIPDGFKIESLPKDLYLKIDGESCIFKFNCLENNGSVQVISNFEVNKTMLPAEEYQNLKQFFKLMIEKQAEKIVMVKK